MSRFRLVLLSVLAVCAVGAVAAGSASAHEFKGPALPAKIIDLSGTSLLESEVGGVKVIIECEDDISEGEIEANGESKGEIKFYNCRLWEITAGGVKKLVTSCTVREPIEFPFKDLLIEGKGFGPEEEFFPPTGTTFITIHLEGGLCALAGEYKATTTVEGKGVFCALPEWGVAKDVHEVVCTSTGDERLRFGTAKATFHSTDLVALKAGGTWYAN